MSNSEDHLLILINALLSKGVTLMCIFQKNTYGTRFHQGYVITVTSTLIKFANHLFDYDKLFLNGDMCKIFRYITLYRPIYSEVRYKDNL